MPQAEICRCAWAEADPLLRAYHDAEWGVPQRDSRALWEMLMLEGFQAGLSWLVVLRKREAFRKAFLDFDPEKVACFGEAEIARLLNDSGIIRSRAKIRATIEGARVFVRHRDAGEDFTQWIWAEAGGSPIVTTGRPPRHTQTALSERISHRLRSRGYTFVGPVIVYAWLQAVGIVSDHDLACFRRP